LYHIFCSWSFETASSLSLNCSIKSLPFIGVDWGSFKLVFPSAFCFLSEKPALHNSLSSKPVNPCSRTLSTNVSVIKTSTTVVLTEKAIAFCNDKTETWLDVAFANKTKPKYESTEQLVAKGLFPGAVALPEPSRASQSPAAFECSQALEGTPPLFSEVRRDSRCPHDG